MARQDYVSHSPNKKNNPYKNTNAEVPTGISLKMKLISIFTLVALCGFAYLLWSIKDQRPIDTNIVIKTPATSINKSTVLPLPPKEKWAYKKELEEKKVEEGKYTVTENGPYKMQCGSFKTKKQAEVLKANIAFSGLSAQISDPVGSQSTYYKVFLGPYEKKRDAEKDKHKLRNNNINYCEIWLWK